MAYTRRHRSVSDGCATARYIEIKRTEPSTSIARSIRPIGSSRGVSNTFEPTKNDEYRGDREMTICAMAGGRRRATPGSGARLRTEALTGDVGGSCGVPPSSPAAAARCRHGAPADEPILCVLAALKRLVSPRPAQAAQATPAGTTPAKRHNLSYTRRCRRPTASGSGPRASGPAIYDVEIQKKLAISARMRDLSRCSACRSRFATRGGVGHRDRTSTGVFSVYYVGLNRRRGAGRPAHRAPFFAMWTPNLISSPSRSPSALRATRRQHRARR